MHPLSSFLPVLLSSLLPIHLHFSEWAGRILNLHDVVKCIGLALLSICYFQHKPTCRYYDDLLKMKHTASLSLQKDQKDTKDIFPEQRTSLIGLQHLFPPVLLNAIEEVVLFSDFALKGRNTCLSLRVTPYLSLAHPTALLHLCQLSSLRDNYSAFKINVLPTKHHSNLSRNR